ncbi:MAG: FAD-binding oxidoreductase [Anaerolineales bacterium]|nr:FAD-binding oxidoreductase [Anaerolineales bacterium]
MKTFDAIIIGGGIAGVSLAFHLAQRGLKPVVLERSFVAAHATGHASGLVRMHYDLEGEARLAWVSFEYFRNWQTRVGGECGFTRTGFLDIVAPAQNDRVRANVALHQQIGIPSLLVTADDVRRLAPSFVTDDFELAAYEPESGYADPSATAGSLMTAARAQGAALVQGCRVLDIATDGDRVLGVETDQEAYSAPIVVNAAGSWAREVGLMVGVDLPLTTWTHEVFYIRRPPIVPTHPTVIDDSLSMYFRPETGGLTLIALEDENRFDEAPDADLGPISRDAMTRAVDRLCMRIPAMAEGSFHSAHAGRDGLTPDQRPVLGQVGPKGFYVACGFSGTGFKLGPAVGLCMAELILDGKATTVDISVFDPGRFSRGEMLKGQFGHTMWR